MVRWGTIELDWNLKPEAVLIGQLLLLCSSRAGVRGLIRLGLRGDGGGPASPHVQFMELSAMYWKEHCSRYTTLSCRYRIMMLGLIDFASSLAKFIWATAGRNHSVW